MLNLLSGINWAHRKVVLDNTSLFRIRTSLNGEETMQEDIVIQQNEVALYVKTFYEENGKEENAGNKADLMNFITTLNAVQNMNLTDHVTERYTALFEVKNNPNNIEERHVNAINSFEAFTHRFPDYPRIERTPLSVVLEARLRGEGGEELLSDEEDEQADQEKSGEMALD